MARFHETGGESSRQHRSFSGGEGSVPQRPTHVVSPNNVPEISRPTAFVSKDGTPKTSSGPSYRGTFRDGRGETQGRVGRAIIRGVGIVQEWREGRSTKDSKPVSPTDIKPEQVVVLPSTSAPKAQTPQERTSDSQFPPDETPTNEFPVVPAMSPADREATQHAAEDDSLVKAIDWLMAKSATGNKQALTTAGRLMALAELRGGGLVGRLERLANTTKAPPATEPTALDLYRLDEVFADYARIPEADRAGLIAHYGSDFDNAQLAGLREFTENLREQQEGRRRR